MNSNTHESTPEKMSDTTATSSTSAAATPSTPTAAAATRSSTSFATTSPAASASVTTSDLSQEDTSVAASSTLESTPSILTSSSSSSTTSSLRSILNNALNLMDTSMPTLTDTIASFVALTTPATTAVATSDNAAAAAAASHSSSAAAAGPTAAIAPVVSSSPPSIPAGQRAPRPRQMATKMAVKRRSFDHAQLDAAIEDVSSSAHLQPDRSCGVCGNDQDEVIIECKQCHTKVHPSCYGVNPEKLPGGGRKGCDPPNFTCLACHKLLTPVCCLCGQTGGALKPTTRKSEWAHIICALHIPELWFADEDHMGDITGFEYMPKARGKLKCEICKKQVGYSVQCHHKGCLNAFHVFCAKQAAADGYRVEMHYTPSIKPNAVKDDYDVAKVEFCSRHRDVVFDGAAWARRQRKITKAEEEVEWRRLKEGKSDGIKKEKEASKKRKSSSSSSTSTKKSKKTKVEETEEAEQEQPKLKVRIKGQKREDESEGEQDDSMVLDDLPASAAATPSSNTRSRASWKTTSQESANNTLSSSKSTSSKSSRPSDTTTRNEDLSASLSTLRVNRTDDSSLHTPLLDYLNTSGPSIGSLLPTSMTSSLDVTPMRMNLSASFNSSASTMTPTNWQGELNSSQDLDPMGVSNLNGKLRLELEAIATRRTSSDFDMLQLAARLSPRTMMPTGKQSVTNLSPPPLSATLALEQQQQTPTTIQ